MPLTDKDKMPFGKWKGHTMASVPADYLDWLWKQYEANDCQANGRALEVIEYIKRVKWVIDQELKAKQKDSE